METHFLPAIKSGRAWNGSHRDSGIIVHAVKRHFSDLNIFVKVIMFYLYLISDLGYWQLPSFIDYKYVGTIKGAYHFQNAKYPVEHNYSLCAFWLLLGSVLGRFVYFTHKYVITNQ